MANVTTNEQIVEKVDKLLGEQSSITIDLNDDEIKEIAPLLSKSRTRLALSKNYILVDLPKQGTEVTISRITNSGIENQEHQENKNQKPQKPKQTPKKTKHSYVQPNMAKDIKDAILDESSHVLWFKGPTGTGKTVLAHHIAQELGYKLYKINCDGGLGPEGFFGDKTIDIDEETGQNHIVWKDGPVVQAMQEGLDENGNEVGAPAILFLDEAGSIPPHVSIALNHLLESDNPKRQITLNNDGGRVITSHSKFRIVFAANTAGRGATNMSEAAYTAQMDALDISLLNRISMTFRFGYNKKIEKSIAMEKIGDDKIVLKLMKIRDGIRDNIKQGKLSTPFSTREIVNIADTYRLYNDLGKAFYYTIFEQLLPEEQSVYNEVIYAHLGVDILDSFTDDEVDYL